MFRPQHHASPSVVTAQVCTAPAAIATNCSSLRTRTGVERGERAPVAELAARVAAPSSRPHRSAVTPHVCALPAVIDWNSMFPARVGLTAIAVGPVSELTRRIVSPAHRPAAVVKPAGEVPPHVEAHEALRSGHGDGRRPVDAPTVAQLPCASDPQHQASRPAPARTCVLLRPLLREMHALPQHVSGSRGTCVRSPSWPWSFSPQHHSEPPRAMAQLCARPGATATNRSSDPTAAGVDSRVLPPPCRAAPRRCRPSRRPPIRRHEAGVQPPSRCSCAGERRCDDRGRGSGGR